MAIMLLSFSLRSIRFSQAVSFLLLLVVPVLFYLDDRLLIGPSLSLSASQSFLVEEFAAVNTSSVVTSKDSHRLPDCEVLVTNHEFNFHYEVLESVMALYPLPPFNHCDHRSLRFTFMINHGHANFPREKSYSWTLYANQTISKNSYYSYVTQGQVRRLREVVRVPRTTYVQPPGFDYIIKVSCYCRLDLEWLQNNTQQHYCVFHETCETVQDSPQAMWLNPHHKRYFLPTLLPRFNSSISSANNSIPINMCIVGSPGRRNYDLLANYLELHNQTDRVRFHNLGWGSLPKVMDPWLDRIQVHSVPGFQAFQERLVHTCHAIVSMLQPSANPDYFHGSRKLSGSIVQAAAYRLPIVLHHDLARLYQGHLAFVEPHGDDQSSFDEAVQRMIHRLEEQLVNEKAILNK
jgi:hypothetical protein